MMADGSKGNFLTNTADEINDMSINRMTVDRILWVISGKHHCIMCFKQIAVMYKCKGCGNGFYCSKKCQKFHWSVGNHYRLMRGHDGRRIDGEDFTAAKCPSKYTFAVSVTFCPHRTQCQKNLL